MRTMIIPAIFSAMLLGSQAFAQSSTSGKASNPSATNSGAGVPGLPGSKSGSTQTPSGTTPLERSATSPDTSRVPGLPGSKSGPSERSPKQ
jgi:hypothetical protein